MRVLFAPDWRAGNQYQRLLAEALSPHGVEVSFLSDYHRGLPLFRGTRSKAPDLIHVHWPEAYFSHRGDFWDSLRVGRYPLDCLLTAHYRPMVLTAHNLIPHNRAAERGVFRNARCTGRMSQAVFVHSDTARRVIRESFALSDDRIHVIPFGDHSVTIGSPLPRNEARAQLKLPLHEKICLVFGTISPYKGSDELVRFWAENRIPYRLVIVGPITSEAYAKKLYRFAQGCTMIDLHLLNEWLDDATLRLWLSAADCSIFNYREIFTSGAAALARSYGLPLLIPNRLASANLDEPHSHVFRFATLDADFCVQLERALTTTCDYDIAREWRRRTCWDGIAKATALVYRDIVREGSR
jgi:glycosyltransferase involved in cell wall biosynthesis